ncbi:unnamed protein product [Arctogadus glacialis]
MRRFSLGTTDEREEDAPRGQSLSPQTVQSPGVAEREALNNACAPRRVLREKTPSDQRFSSPRPGGRCRAEQVLVSCPTRRQGEGGRRVIPLREGMMESATRLTWPAGGPGWHQRFRSAEGLLLRHPALFSRQILAPWANSPPELGAWQCLFLGHGRNELDWFPCLVAMVINVINVVP